MRVYAQMRWKRIERREEVVEVATIILCSLAYANDLTRNNNKKRSNELAAASSAYNTSLCPHISDSQRSEERKQQRAEETRLLESNLQHKERDRKRKLTALPVKVSPTPLHRAIGLDAKIPFFPFVVVLLSSNYHFFPSTSIFLPFPFLASVTLGACGKIYRYLRYCISELISLIMLVTAR